MLPETVDSVLRGTDTHLADRLTFPGALDNHDRAAEGDAAEELAPPVSGMDEDGGSPLDVLEFIAESVERMLASMDDVGARIDARMVRDRQRSLERVALKAARSRELPERGAARIIVEVSLDEDFRQVLHGPLCDFTNSARPTMAATNSPSQEAMMDEELRDDAIP